MLKVAVVLVAMLVLVVSPSVHGMPDVRLGRHQQAEEVQGPRIRSSAVPVVSTTAVSGGGGAGGGSGFCFGFGTPCVDNCKRAGFESGYCFFFRCYCTDDL